MAAAPLSPRDKLQRHRPRLFVYVSGHGFGHFLRTANLLEHLLRQVPCELDVRSPVDPQAWPATLRASVRRWRVEPCDVGVVQMDELEVDHAGTEQALREWGRGYAGRLEEERRALIGSAAAVLGDVPPLAFDAAAESGVPSFALANFSWDWIYTCMGFAGAAEDARRAYARAGLLLELTPAAPMPAFRSRIPVGVLGRSAERGRQQTRVRLGLEPQERLVLVAFRSVSSCRLPPPSFDVRYLCCDGSAVQRHDVVTAPPDVVFTDLVAAADAVVAKTGYGIIADAAASGTPLLYTARAGFPEDAVLMQWLAGSPWARQVDRERLVSGSWSTDLDEVLSLERPEPCRAHGLVDALDAIRSALQG